MVSYGAKYYILVLLKLPQHMNCQQCSCNHKDTQPEAYGTQSGNCMVWLKPLRWSVSFDKGDTGAIVLGANNCNRRFSQTPQMNIFISAQGIVKWPLEDPHLILSSKWPLNTVRFFKIELSALSYQRWSDAKQELSILEIQPSISSSQRGSDAKWEHLIGCSPKRVNLISCLCFLQLFQWKMVCLLWNLFICCTFVCLLSLIFQCWSLTSGGLGMLFIRKRATHNLTCYQH